MFPFVVFKDIINNGQKENYIKDINMDIIFRSHKFTD